MARKAFTLVELIVVITILAILWAIAFVSFKDYTKDAKDTKVITDISNLNKTLGLFQIRSGIMPIPENAKEVTQGAWNTITFQWNIWKRTKSILGLSKEATSPYENEEYGYDINGNKSLYKVYGYVTNGNSDALKEIRKDKVNQYKVEKWDALLNVYNGSWEIAQVDITNLPSSENYIPILGNTILDIDSNAVKNIPEEIEKNQKYTWAGNSSNPVANLPYPLNFLNFIQGLQTWIGTYIFSSTIDAFSPFQINNKYIFASRGFSNREPALAFSDLTPTWTFFSTTHGRIEFFDKLTNSQWTDLLLFGSNRKLRASDWTEEWTIALNDNINYVDNLIVIWNKAVFEWTTSTWGGELYITDGTPEWTTILKDLTLWTSSTSPDKLFLYNNKVYFTTRKYDSSLRKTVYRIWVTDWTTSWTKILNSIPLMTNFITLSFCNNNVYISRGWIINSTNDSYSNPIPSVQTAYTYCINNTWYIFSNSNLRKTDGTDSWTTLIKSFSWYNYVSINGKANWKVILTAKINSKIEVWQTDWTSEWTVKVTYNGNDLITYSGAPYESFNWEYYFLATVWSDNIVWIYKINNSWVVELIVENTWVYAVQYYNGYNTAAMSIINDILVIQYDLQNKNFASSQFTNTQNEEIFNSDSISQDVFTKLTSIDLNGTVNTLNFDTYILDS